jgi:hypothetical protein
MPSHSNATDLEPDELGFYHPRCSCGWKFGPVPDLDVLIDCMMDHAIDATVSDR